MKYGYIVLPEAIKFDAKQDLTKDDILACFAENKLHEQEGLLVLTERRALAIANEADDEKAENEGFPLIKVGFADDIKMSDGAYTLFGGTKILGKFIESGNLNFVRADVRHLCDAYEEHAAIKLGFKHAAVVAASEENSSETGADKQALKASEPENNKPSRLSALFTRRNVLIASAALVTAGLLVATPLASMIATSAAGVYFGTTFAVLAGSIGLGLLVRKYSNRKAAASLSEYDSTDNSADASPELSLDSSSDCCKGKNAKPEAPFVEESTSTLAAKNNAVVIASDSSSSSDSSSEAANDEVADAALSVSSPTLALASENSSPSSSPVRGLPHSNFDDVRVESASSSSSDSSSEEDISAPTSPIRKAKV